MSKIISKAQKTFVDLYDSYVLNVSSDIVAVPCDQNGKVLKTFTTYIDVEAFAGKNPVGVKFDQLIHPTSGTITSFNDTYKDKVYLSYESKQITFKFYKGYQIADDFKIVFQFATKDNSQFTFERTFTIIKIKNGEKATTFKIYSDQGDTFKEGVDKITMKTALFDGLNVVSTSDIKYVWKYYDTEEKDEEKAWKDVIINDKNHSKSTLAINRSEKWADAVFTCIAAYNGKKYEDYFMLTTKDDKYEIVTKFFSGRNEFGHTTPFIVAYFELYKNQKKIEGRKATISYYHEKNTYNATKNKVTYFSSAGIDEKYKKEGQQMYCIYKVEDRPDDTFPRYIVKLIKYNNGKWVAVNIKSNYLYKNSLYASEDVYDVANLAPNIFVIAESDVARKKTIYTTASVKIPEQNGDSDVDDTDLILCRTQMDIYDTGDPIINSSAPKNNKEGQLWLDTSTKPYVLMMWNGESWEKCAEQKGKTVYTTKPSNYQKGDLWIVEKEHGESNFQFSEGDLLVATKNSNQTKDPKESGFDKSHWKDALLHWSEYRKNIEQYWEFKPEGMTIGQKGSKIKAVLSSDRLGFYNSKDEEVVYIGSGSAHIDHVDITGSATFADKCEAHFCDNVNIYKNGDKENGFTFKVENNNSFSLVLVD